MPGLVNPGSTPGASDEATELAKFKAGKNRSFQNIIDDTHVRFTAIRR